MARARAEAMAAWAPASILICSFNAFIGACFLQTENRAKSCARQGVSDRLSLVPVHTQFVIARLDRAIQ